MTEFLDRELAAPERSQAEAHLSACSGCRSEYEELHGISKMVAGVGRKPLPVGFMQRLERRRQAGESPAPSRNFFLLPPGIPRYAAFALSSLIVMFVVMDKARNMLQPELGTISGVASNMAVDAPRRAPAAAPKFAAAPPASDTLSSVRGAGGGGSGGFAALKKAAGGQPNDFDRAGQSAAGSLDEAASRNLEVAGARDNKSAVESVDFLKQKAELQQRLVSEKEAKDASVTSTGKALARAKGEPLDAPAAAPAEGKAKVTSNEELIAGIEAEKKRSKMRIIPPSSREERTRLAMLSAMQGANSASAFQLRAQVAPASLGPGQTPMIIAQEPAKVGSAVPDLERLDKNGKLDEAPGVLIRSETERRDLWHKYEMTAAPPKIDYASQMLAVVFATSPSTSIQISRVTPSEDRIVVSYHELPLANDAKALAVPSYQFRVIPKTEKPVYFEKLP
ncbi:MAG: zf-HC2 domain-containing protein [Elusimicrobia bacterium]|nr:zf-HC2 domain-containing protein [Elusimicrobiota bacterium]